MLRFENVAMPETAATGVVPDRVAPPVPAPLTMPTATLAVPAVRLPSASRIATCTAGLIVLPAVRVLGWTTNESRVAAPAATAKVELVAVARPVDDAVSA